MGEEKIYGIFAVCYKDNKIYECQAIELKEDKSGNLILHGDVKNFKRTEIYHDLKLHNKYVTLNITTGANVLPYQRDGENYITTAKNDTDKDDLESLPKYDSLPSFFD